MKRPTTMTMLFATTAAVLFGDVVARGQNLTVTGQGTFNNLSVSGMVDGSGNVGANSQAALLYWQAGEGEVLRLKGNNALNMHIENLNGTLRLINSPWTAELFHVDQSGNAFTSGSLGVGTSSPAYKLEVMGDIRANGGWLRTVGNTGWYNDTYCGGWVMTDSSWIRSYCGKAVYMDNNLAVAGSVGVGTTSPGSLLNIVAGDQGPWAFSIRNNTYSTSEGAAFRIYQDNGGTTHLYNNGIDTADLTGGKLQVNGSLRLGMIEMLEKAGDNGSASCSTFCMGSQWAGWAGSCVAAFATDTGSPVSCTVTNGVNGLNCLCARLNAGQVYTPASGGGSCPGGYTNCGGSCIKPPAVCP